MHVCVNGFKGLKRERERKKKIYFFDYEFCLETRNEQKIPKRDRERRRSSLNNKTIQDIVKQEDKAYSHIAIAR